MKIALVAVAGLAAAANAQFFTIGPFPITGAQEVPAVNTPASGTATLLLNTTTGDFQLNYSFSGLLGTVTVAHFHRAAAGSNGSVVYWLAAQGAPNTLPTTLLSPALPGGVTAASGTGTGRLGSSALINDALNGLLYINIHSTRFGPGEIRGQVVPAPAGLALVGVAGLAAARRRRA